MLHPVCMFCAHVHCTTLYVCSVLVFSVPPCIMCNVSVDCVTSHTQHQSSSTLNTWDCWCFLLHLVVYMFCAGVFCSTLRICSVLVFSAPPCVYVLCWCFLLHPVYMFCAGVFCATLCNMFYVLQCRLRDITYSAPIVVDIEYMRQGKTVVNKVTIGRSLYCHFIFIFTLCFTLYFTVSLNNASDYWTNGQYQTPNHSPNSSLNPSPFIF